jgi:hypothetical protein
MRPRGCISLPPLPSPLSLPPLGCPRGREKINKNLNLNLNKKILVVVAGLEREKKFTIFGFRFSIPELPELHGLCGRSREKKKVFSA